MDRTAVNPAGSQLVDRWFVYNNCIAVLKRVPRNIYKLPNYPIPGPRPSFTASRLPLPLFGLFTSPYVYCYLYDFTATTRLAEGLVDV